VAVSVGPYRQEGKHSRKETSRQSRKILTGLGQRGRRSGGGEEQGGEGKDGEGEGHGRRPPLLCSVPVWTLEASSRFSLAAFLSALLRSVLTGMGWVGKELGRRRRVGPPY
jgi:hypothetical protein